MDLNSKLRNVADVAAQIMSEGLKGNQHKLDKNKNNKIDAEDFKILRKEDEQKDDTILEYESKDGKYVHKGTYGYAGKGAEHGETDYKKANDDEKKESKPNRRKYGARQNYVRSGRVNEFTELLNTYKEGGLKSLGEAWAKKKMMKEEPTQEEFTAELEKQKAKQAGTAKQAEVAKPAVAAVQNEETHTQVEVLDLNGVNGVQQSFIDLDERSLTDAENAKKEEIVKSMKKGMAGFKERYGDRAKSVMYATATKQAKKD
jgi:hypothetical protein